MGFNRRFDKSFRRVRSVVVSGEIGRPCILRITNRDPDFPLFEFLRVSGGMFLDMTIHDFDMARFLLGEVDEVYAMGAILLDPALEQINDIDTDIVMLRFANGAIGRDRQQPPGGVRLRPASGGLLFERRRHRRQ